LTVGRVGFIGFKTRYIGDALYSPSESPCVAVESISESACPNNGQSRLAFAPVSPDSSQLITFTVGVPNYLFLSQQAAVATLQGNTINVTLTAVRNIIGLPPPLQCATAVIGPLPAGSYPVNFFLVSTDPPAPAVLVATSMVIVAPQQAAPVPTLSECVLGALAVLLAGSSVVLLRRRV
jgi:hypothetical protein